MLNFLIVCSKSGMPIKTLGTIPKGYHDSEISNMATMINYYTKEFHEDKEIIDDDFTIFLRKNEPPFAKAKDKSIIKLIEGEYVNIIYSGSENTDLNSVYETLKSSDFPTDPYGKIKKKDLSDIMEDLIFTRVNLYKSRK